MKRMLGLILAGLLLTGCSRPVRVEPLRVAPVAAPARVVRLEMTATLSDIPKDGRELRLWMPLPVRDAHQVIRDQEIVSTLRPMLRYTQVHGNGTVFFTGDDPLPESLSATVRLTVELHQCDANVKPALAEFTTKSPGAPVERYLTVPDDKWGLEGVASQIPALEGTPADRALVIYHRLLEQVSLSSEPVAERSLAEAWASGMVSERECARILVGLLRLSGIPARLEYGILLGPEPVESVTEVAQPHVWVGGFTGETGWLPMDPVGAEQEPELADFYFGTDCARRLRIGVGDEIVLSPETLGKPLPIFFVPVAEVDKTTLEPGHRVTVRDLAGLPPGQENPE